MNIFDKNGIRMYDSVRKPSTIICILGLLMILYIVAC